MAKNMGRFVDCSENITFRILYLDTLTHWYTKMSTSLHSSCPFSPTKQGQYSIATLIPWFLPLVSDLITGILPNMGSQRHLVPPTKDPRLNWITRWHPINCLQLTEQFWRVKRLMGKSHPSFFGQFLVHMSDLFCYLNLGCNTPTATKQGTFLEFKRGLDPSTMNENYCVFGLGSAKAWLKVWKEFQDLEHTPSDFRKSSSKIC